VTLLALFGPAFFGFFPLNRFFHSVSPVFIINFEMKTTTYLQQKISKMKKLRANVQNKIRVFPCWPSDKDAKSTRLQTQGGFLVSAEQENGKVVSLVIGSTAGGKLSLHSPWPTIKMKRRSRVQALTANSRGIVQIDTPAKETMAFFAE
jgi:hypothetical protein